MKLHLVRHANAKSSDGVLDFNRILSGKGKLQAKNLANYLVNKKLPNEVWCSSASRTIETLSYIEKSHIFSKKKEMGELYLCSKDVYLKELWQKKTSHDLLIVGHNFGISDLVNYFTGELIVMSTAEYICIDFGGLNLSESSKDTGTIIERFIP